MFVSLPTPVYFLLFHSVPILSICQHFDIFIQFIFNTSISMFPSLCVCVFFAPTKLFKLCFSIYLLVSHTPCSLSHHHAIILSLFPQLMDIQKMTASYEIRIKFFRQYSTNVMYSTDMLINAKKVGKIEEKQQKRENFKMESPFPYRVGNSHSICSKEIVRA